MTDDKCCVLTAFFGPLARHLPERARALIVAFACFRHAIFSPRFGDTVPIPDFARHLAAYLYRWECPQSAKRENMTALVFQKHSDDLLFRWAQQLPLACNTRRWGDHCRANYHYIFSRHLPLRGDAETISPSWLKIKLFGVTGLMATLTSPLYDALTRYQGRKGEDVLGGTRLRRGPSTSIIVELCEVQAVFFGVYEMVVEQMDRNDLDRLRDA